MHAFAEGTMNHTPELTQRENLLPTSISCPKTIVCICDHYVLIFILASFFFFCSRKGGTVDLVRSDGVVKMSLSTGNVFGFVDSQLGKPRGTTAYARAPPSQLSLQGNNSSSTNDFNGSGGNGSDGAGNSLSSADARSSLSSAAAVKVAVISMASLERMSADYPGIAVKLMKVLLRQSSLELSNS